MEMSFAYESHMDEIGHGLGIVPVELCNLLKVGDETATGDRPKAVGLTTALEALMGQAEGAGARARDRVDRESRVAQGCSNSG
jgi:hypothetical protein